MNSTDWTTLLMNWLPFIVLIVVWIVLSRQMRGRGSLGKLGVQYDLQLEEMRRQTALMERIAVALEKRASS